MDNIVVPCFLIHSVYIHFGGFCPITEFCQLQSSLCVQVLRFPILAALMLGTRAAAISQTLRRDTRNGITELSHRARHLFGWAAITLGIGQHFSSSFFLAYSQRSQIGCLPYFHTWCGLSANLECRSEVCCMRLAESTGRKNSPSAHHRISLSGYIFATKACIDNRKELLKSNISSTCPHNMVNFSLL